MKILSYVLCAMLMMITASSCPMEVTVQFRVYTTSKDQPICCALSTQVFPEQTMISLLTHLAEEHNFADSVSKELYVDLHEHPYMRNVHQSPEAIQQAEGKIQSFFGPHLGLQHVNHGLFKVPMLNRLKLYAHLLKEYDFCVEIIEK